MSSNMNDIQFYLQHVHVPSPDSHKGQNGKLLLIGGSNLFHAASRWCLDVASKFVDMVFYASVPSNNELIQEAKKNFWNGMVIRREDVESYIAEADCIVIGPGMDRSDAARDIPAAHTLSAEDWNTNAQKIINYLLTKYPHKKFVVDAGALQMVNAQFLNEHCILTPHHAEWQRVLGEASPQEFLQRTRATVVVKGKVDHVLTAEKDIVVEGGNAGMTKGGTGDILAGLIAALYCTNDAVTACVVGSWANKKAGDLLYNQTGPFFNASDLVNAIPKVLWDGMQKRP